jgi:hypothetical protein
MGVDLSLVAQDFIERPVERDRALEDVDEFGMRG